MEGKPFHTGCRSNLFHRYICPARLVLRWGRPGPFISACPMICFSSVMLLESTIPVVPACVAPWAPGLPTPASRFSTF